MTADFAGFSRWATGNLVDNRNRGIFAEWLVGQALGVIEAEYRGALAQLTPDGSYDWYPSDSVVFLANSSF